MQWRNSNERFGWIAVSLHWLVALTVCSLFAVGWWMTELDYYDEWYQRAPWWHKSVGIVLFFVLCFRVYRRLVDPAPKSLSSHKPWEVKTAKVIHVLLYGLLLVIALSGYLISTADGRAISVFGWFSVPASITFIPDQEEVAGAIHFYVAVVLMSLVSLHALAGLKHHFLDKDRTLLRMLGK